MVDSFEFKLTGFDDLVSLLKTLSPKLQKSGLRKAARKAMNIVRDDARNRARQIDDPETVARIHKNIVTQESAKQSRKVGGVVMRVGVKGGASSNQFSKDKSKLSGGDTTHWRYVEFGTSDTPAVPFMRPALDQNITAVTSKFRTELMIEVGKLL